MLLELFLQLQLTIMMLNKDSHKLVDQSDDLEEVAKPSSECKTTAVSNSISQDGVNQ